MPERFVTYEFESGRTVDIDKADEPDFLSQVDQDDLTIRKVVVMDALNPDGNHAQFAVDKNAETAFTNRSQELGLAVAPRNAPEGFRFDTPGEVMIESLGLEGVVEDRPGFSGALEDFFSGLFVRGSLNALDTFNSAAQGFEELTENVGNRLFGIPFSETAPTGSDAWRMAQAIPKPGSGMDATIELATGRPLAAHTESWLAHAQKDFSLARPSIQALTDDEGITSRGNVVTAAESIATSLVAAGPGIGLGFLGGGKVGATVGGAASSFALFGGSEYDRFLDEVEALGFDRTDVEIQSQAIKAAVITGSIETIALAVDIFTAKVGGLALRSLAQGMLKNTVKGTAAVTVGGLTEGVTEGVQGVVGANIKNATTDVEGQQVFSPVPTGSEAFRQGFNPGFVAGLIFSGGGAVLSAPFQKTLKEQGISQQTIDEINSEPLVAPTQGTDFQKEQTLVVDAQDETDTPDQTQPPAPLSDSETTPEIVPEEGIIQEPSVTTPALAREPAQKAPDATVTATLDEATIQLAVDRQKPLTERLTALRCTE